MKKDNIIRSPMFYTGDKYKLMKEIKHYFPHKINKFIEPFVGGGSVFLNVDANSFLENDIDSNIMTLHSFLSSFGNVDDLESKLFKETSAVSGNFGPTIRMNYENCSKLWILDVFDDNKSVMLAESFISAKFGIA